MRLTAAPWLLAAGCWHAAPALPPEPAAPPAPPAACDATRWRELASTPRRAWLVSLDAPRAHRAGPPSRDARRPRWPVAVLALDGADARIATVRDGLIVARWVAASALARVATAGAAVSPAPGAAPDPAVRIRPGYRLPDADGPWLSVAHPPAALDGLELEGFVPAGLRGFTWDEPPPAPPPARAVRREGDILDAPHAAARPRAKVTREAAIEVRGTRSGYWEITARTPRAEVDGFLPAPPPPPPRPRHSGRYEFSEDTIDGVLVLPPSPLPPGTCLHDAPGGEVVGMILGPQPATLRPSPRVPGWSAVELATLWGTATYYTPAGAAAPTRP